MSLISPYAPGVTFKESKVLNQQFGIKSMPIRNNLPWTLITNNKVTIKVWSDGQYLVIPTGMQIGDAVEVETFLANEFGKKEITDNEYAALAMTLQPKVRYGIMGPTAMEKSQMPGYR